MPLQDAAFAFVDIETTGGNVVYDRIIEIAIIVVEGNTVTKKWSTLVDPQRSVPSMITTITGLTNRDLENAPSFREISEELLEILEGKIFVAHNARFDYGFIKNEFKRMGISWSAKTLCTVRLSKALYPRFRSHNLDSIIERFGFGCENRHRALDDIKVCVDFWYRAQEERGEEKFQWCVGSLLKRPSLPSHLSAKSVENAPEGTGVYIFYGQGKRPLYIGKSVDLRSRVLQHFSGDHQLRKDMEISQRVRSVEFRETVGELGALLLESQLIKQHLPIYNVKLRRVSSQCAIKVVAGKKKYESITFVKAKDIHPTEFDSLYGVFRGDVQAKERILELCEAYTLCPKILGLEKSDSYCFSYHLKKCKGACGGEEDHIAHNARLRMALSNFKHKSWPFPGKIGIRETHLIGNETEVHLVDQWCYLGTYKTEDDLSDALAGDIEPNFNLDNYRIISSWLKGFTAKKQRHKQWEIEILSFPQRISMEKLGNVFAPMEA